MSRNVIVALCLAILIILTMGSIVFHLPTVQVAATQNAASDVASWVKEGELDQDKYPRLSDELIPKIITEGNLIYEQIPPLDSPNFGEYAVSVWLWREDVYVIYAGGWAGQHTYGIGPIKRKIK